MKTSHLVYSDEATALAAFALVVGEPVPSIAEIPPWLWSEGARCAIDVVGLVDEHFGEVDADGRSIVGFRVNVLTPDDVALPPVLADAEVRPVVPMRVFG